MDGFPHGYAGINDPNTQRGIYEDVHVRRDDELTKWRIAVHGDKADVIITAWLGNPTEEWVVVSKTSEYLILARQNV